MAIVNTVQEVLHRVKAKLYPNQLLNKGGKYIARTTRADALSIEDVCAFMKNRGGYTGDYGYAVNTIKHYFKEAVYQLCDGRTVNTDFFTIVHTGAVNKTFTPGGPFVITGSKIKLAGKDPDVGVYFTSTDGSGREIKAGQPVKNTCSELIGTIPRKLSTGTWKITVKTQYTGATNKLLKTPRTIESGFTVTGG